MPSDAHSLIASTIEHARQTGNSHSVFKIDDDYLVDFWVEYNGGLPIIGYRNLDTGEFKQDVTAFQLLDLLESFQ